jgi:DNA-binding response OmpR family regulator
MQKILLYENGKKLKKFLSKFFSRNGLECEEGYRGEKNLEKK